MWNFGNQSIAALSPSLIGFMGGRGKALAALGGAMGDVGQAKLDLEQRASENGYRQSLIDNQKAQLDLSAANAEYTKQKASDQESDQLAASRFMAKRFGLPLGEEVQGQTNPETYAQNSAILRGLGVDGMKAMLPEQPKYKGTYNGADGKRYVEWSDGTSSPLQGGADPFISEGMKITTQYIGDKPTIVRTNLFTGDQKNIGLPGQTDSVFEDYLRSSLSLGNTLTAQSHKAKLDLENQPAIDDRKNQNEVENTIKTLAESGFTQELTPGQVSYYQQNMKKGNQLNVQTVKVNGVDKYFTKPNNIYTKPKSSR